MKRTSMATSILPLQFGAHVDNYLQNNAGDNWYWPLLSGPLKPPSHVSPGHFPLLWAGMVTAVMLLEKQHSLQSLSP